MKKEEYLVVEGATITPAMVGQIKDWQHSGTLDNGIEFQQKTINYLIDKIGELDFNSDDAVKLLPLLVGLRDTMAALEKFKIDSN